MYNHFDHLRDCPWRRELRQLCRERQSVVAPVSNPFASDSRLPPRPWSPQCRVSPHPMAEGRGTDSLCTVQPHFLFCPLCSREADLGGLALRLSSGFGHWEMPAGGGKAGGEWAGA